MGLFQLEVSGFPGRDLKVSTFIFLYPTEFNSIKIWGSQIYCSVVECQNYCEKSQSKCKCSISLFIHLLSMHYALGSGNKIYNLYSVFKQPGLVRKTSMGIITTIPGTHGKRRLTLLKVSGKAS